MEGYTKLKKVIIKEACEETRLELRLCPPGDDFYSNGSPKRAAQLHSVVGWPPVRTSRKNIKTSSNSTKVSSSEKVLVDGSDCKNTSSSNDENSLYVKINMDGVAIGRKVDLKAYDNYHSLSSAVEELFQGLLAGFKCLHHKNKNLNYPF
ncbi:PB1 domain, AUX/IAA protein [Artemisia annua]|uniref:Auxin-responsive protein n=1 Tax=Artemisia annua TaxID=35608 RepID=A0A2U1PCN2_ARTAN|nr:PB1 domain, AUX/IAA protein [Artemisia annua]